MTNSFFLVPLLLFAGPQSPLDALKDAVKAGEMLASRRILAEINQKQEYIALAESYLIKEMGNTDPEIRFVAADGLGLILANPDKAIPALANGLSDKDSRVRAAAAWSLSSFGHKAIYAAKQLEFLLSDTDDSVVRWAAYTLGKCGKGAKGSTSALLAAIERASEPYSKAVIATAVWRIDSSKHEAMRAVLIQVLEGEEPVSRALAANSLGEMGVSDAKALALYKVMLRDDDWELRAAAARTLGRLGTQAKDACGELVGRLDDRELIVAFLAKDALVRIGADALPALENGIKKASPLVRIRCIAVIGEIGPKARSSLPILRELEQDQDEEVREEARKAIIRIGSSDK